MKLSIITVTLNNLVGLKRTQNSVAKQTWRDFEWIVIDGGSQDGSVEFIKTLPAQPNWWVSERDSGVYAAMNKGVAHANGKYVIFMNAGDVFHSNDTLEEVFKREFTADVMYGDWIRVSVHHKQYCKSPPILYPFYFFADNICQQAMFVKTQLLKESGFDESYRIYGDLAKWRKMMLEGRTFGYLPVVVCDFEAEIGLSEVYSVCMENDCKRLEMDFPIGLSIQGKKLYECMADMQSLQHMRQWLIVRWAIAIERRITVWRMQGVLKTWKNFCLKIKEIFQNLRNLRN